MAVTLNYNWQNVASYFLDTGGGGGIYFYIDAKLNSQSSTNNSSVVDTRLNTGVQGYAGGSGYGFSLTGSSGKSGSEVWYYEWETVLTGQITITHNADGKKNYTLSAGAYNNYLGFNINFNGDIILPRIPKAPFVSDITTSAITYNSADASFSVTDDGGATVTSTSLSIYSDSGLTQLVQTISGTSGTFTGLNANKDYWIVGSATNSIGTRTTSTSQIKTEGSVIRFRLNGAWKEAIPYIRVNNQWKEVIPYMRVNGTWKEEK